jgi:hypothetical protein
MVLLCLLLHLALHPAGLSIVQGWPRGVWQGVAMASLFGHPTVYAHDPLPHLALHPAGSSIVRGLAAQRASTDWDSTRGIWRGIGVGYPPTINTYQLSVH